MDYEIILKVKPYYRAHITYGEDEIVVSARGKFMDYFKHDTYVVLDLPKEISEQVRKIRYRFKDRFYTALPPEITVAGSSGGGVLQNNQEPDQVFKILDDIATKILISLWSIFVLAM
ncbi:hypothetical protein [Priestia filamentosa]|uniref:hypothetical protein n=1 Tax=Priestia filamentosa TaxID=1402861 RepID=UPI000365B75C|nr:hypothetical protein [Priestia filamentosa]